MTNRKQQWKIKKGIPQPLGITICPQGVNFALEACKGQQVELVLVHKKSGRESVLSLADIQWQGNVLAFFIEEFSYKDYLYYYRIDHKDVLDPYTRLIEGNREFGMWNSQSVVTLKCGFFQATEFDWQEDEYPQIPLNEVILYSMHVRGFTKHASSKVRKKGTFQGIIEKIPYLKELGVNQIELMPVYEFKEVIEKEEMLYPQYREEENSSCVNYWGYASENYYYAVKKTYAASGDGVTELKSLVRELHKNGMELILEFHFAKDCRISFIIDCLKYWVLEYHVDGFHITGDCPCTEELLKEPLLVDKKIYSSMVNVDDSEKVQTVELDERRAALYSIDYLTNMRSFLKGDSGQVMDAAYYMRRNHHKAGYINFFAYHDGFTMMDMVSYEQKHNEANGEGNQDGWDYNYSWNCGEEGKTRKKKVQELRKRQMKNAWVMLMLSQGVPAILAGDEHCNSQNGNNNVYCQDNEVGWLNWKSLRCYEELYGFVRKLIQFRKKHPVLHGKSQLTMADGKGIGYPDLSYHSDQVWYMDQYRSNHNIGMLYCGDYAATSDTSCDDYIYIAINMDWGKRKFAIPDIPKDRVWHCVIDTAREDSYMDASQELKERVMEVTPRTIVVLVGKKVQVRQNHGKRNKQKK